MANSKMDWAMPVMRAGYAGRGLTYLAIAGLSLFTIWQGGQAKGTSEALGAIETSPFGMLTLALIGIGMICYMGWRLLDGFADLEDEGSDAMGLLSRAGQIITGLIHGVIGGAALAIAFRGGDSGGQSQIVKATETVMGLPFGILIVGIVGAMTAGAGLYYLKKAYRQSYRQSLAANHFTRNWSALLRAGVAAQGITVLIIGGFLMLAAWQVDPSQAGGLGQTFDWVSGQLYGRILVTLLCLGLLSFALFLFVNARYRVVPRLSDPDIATLAIT